MAETLSSYTVDAEGGLEILENVAAEGNEPMDMAQTADGEFLYVVSTKSGKVSGFEVKGNGKLVLIGDLEDVLDVDGVTELEGGQAGLGAAIAGSNAAATGVQGPAGLAVL